MSAVSFPSPQSSVGNLFNCLKASARALEISPSTLTTLCDLLIYILKVPCLQIFVLHYQVKQRKWFNLQQCDKPRLRVAFPREPQTTNNDKIWLSCMLRLWYSFMIHQDLCNSGGLSIGLVLKLVSSRFFALRLVSWFASGQENRHCDGGGWWSESEWQRGKKESRFRLLK